MIQNIIFSHIHLMGGWRGFHTLLGGHIEILSCDKTLQNRNHYTKMIDYTELNFKQGFYYISIYYYCMYNYANINKLLTMNELYTKNIEYELNMINIQKL